MALFKSKKKTMKQLKRKAPRVPGNTCPQIDDILKWLKSDEKANFNAKNRSKPIKKYPKPNQITRETLRKILKGKIKIDAEIDLHGMHPGN